MKASETEWGKKIIVNSRKGKIIKIDKIIDETAEHIREEIEKLINNFYKGKTSGWKNIHKTDLLKELNRIFGEDKE